MGAWRRSPSPPPFKDPITDEDDGSRWDWYYGDPGGGTELYFGKYRGHRINQTSWSYLQYCRQNFDKRKNNQRFFQAFDVYRDGLEELADDRYDEFIVPFGKTYRGKEIRQCRDKPWLLWTMRQISLREKYPIFFQAAQNWIDNPRKYAITRDIGRLLSATEYEDDLDLNQDEYREGDEPTTSDEDFIVHDLEDDDIDMDKHGEQMSQDEGTDSGEESEAVATESGICDQPLSQHDSDDSHAVFTDDVLPLSRRTRSNSRLQQPVPRKRKAQPEAPSQVEDTDDSEAVFTSTVTTTPSRDEDTDESEAVFTSTGMITDNQDEDTDESEAVFTGAEESTDNETSDAVVPVTPSNCAKYKRKKRICSRDEYGELGAHFMGDDDPLSISVSTTSKLFPPLTRQKREVSLTIPPNPLPASPKRVRKRACVESESSPDSDDEWSTPRKATKAVRLPARVKREASEISLQTPPPSPRRIFRRRAPVESAPASDDTRLSNTGNTLTKPPKPLAGGKRKTSERPLPTPPPTGKRFAKMAYVKSELVSESSDELPSLGKAFFP